jgi:hypothetical protein
VIVLGARDHRGFRVGRKPLWLDGMLVPPSPAPFDDALDHFPRAWHSRGC